jgi:hypothetical protein
MRLAVDDRHHGARRVLKDATHRASQQHPLQVGLPLARHGDEISRV